MAMDLAIRNASVVRPTGIELLSIGVAEGRIVEIAPELSQKANETIDAAAFHAFPGVVDAHVHFNDPGRADWEGAATGSAAFAAGGGSCFIDMPLNSSPPTLERASFEAKLAALAASHTDFALWGGLTPDNLDRLEELAECGVVGFKAFMSGSGIDDFRACDDLTLYRGMKTAATLGLPVAVHAESEAITSALAAIARTAGRTSIRDYLDSRPILAEAEAISRALLYAEETGCAIHVVHVSSARGVSLVRRAADSGLADATCETCPHYLLFSEEDVMRLGASAKCAPPLRPTRERDRLVAAVGAGRVDTIGSDHSPAPAAMKQTKDFFTVWGGISGVQTTLRTLLTLELPPPLIARLISERPAQRFRLPGKGAIEVGADADLSLVDLTVSAPLRREELLDRHRLSPYVGRTLRGAVRRTLVRGATVYLDGKIVGKPAGRFVRPKMR